MIACSIDLMPTGVVVDVERARLLAWRRADAAGELREVVGRVEDVERGLPVGPVDQVVEVGNDVVDRAAAVAERRAAVHAARALDLGLVFLQGVDELAEILDALLDRLVVFLHALEIHEAGHVAHLGAPSLNSILSTRPRYFGAPSLTGLAAPRALAITSSAALLGADLAERGHRLQADLGQRPLVLVREDLDEAAARLVPVVEDVARAQAAGPFVMVRDECLQQRLVGLPLVPDAALERLFLIGRRRDMAERDHGGVAARGEVAVLVVDVGDAAAHAGGEVASGLAEHDDGAAGHVFAAVVAGAFDDRRRARQAHREALAGDAAEEGLAAGRAVQHGVADDDVLGRVAAEVDARPDREPAAREALAGVVVGVADQVDRDALGEERAEALAAGALHLDEDRVVGQALRVAPDKLAREHRADRAVDVAHLLDQLHLLAALERRGALLDQAHVERPLEAVVLRLDVTTSHLGAAPPARGGCG